MIIEVKQWPDSQEVMGKPGWFFIMDGNPDSSYNGSKIGDSAYGRILEDKTHTAGDIVYDNPLYDGEPTTADEYNNEWLNENSDELNCMFAENGADREMDFDFEKDAQKIYNDNIRENR